MGMSSERRRWDRKEKVMERLEKQKICKAEFIGELQRECNECGGLESG